MPATSKAQFRFMQGVAHGDIKGRNGLTAAKASEFVSGQSPDKLPERAKKNALNRLVNKHKSRKNKWAIR